MNVLVIGGSGFVGTRLVEDLLADEHGVSILDKEHSAQYPDLVTLGDVTSIDDVSKSLDGVDAVYMLAAEHRDDVLPKSRYYETNVGGAKTLVEAMEITGIHHAVFTSTVAVYPLNAESTDENSETAPFNDYGKSKLQAEEVFLEWQKRSANNKLSIVRPCVIFGEGNIGNVHNLITQIKKRRFLMVGSGKNKKSVAYVGNISRFLVRELDSEKSMSITNYADKPDFSVSELVDCICEALDQKFSSSYRLPYGFGLMAGYGFDVLARVISRPLPLSSVRIRKFCANTTVDTSALARSGFQAPYSIREGLTRMVRAMERA